MSITRSRASVSEDVAHELERPEERSLEWHRRQQLAMVAVILVLLDVLFLAANVAHVLSNGPEEAPTRFSGTEWDGTDGSLIEIFGHLQLIAGAVMLGFLVASRRSMVYAAWAFALAVLVLDDFLMLHEDVGYRLAASGDLPAVPGLRAEDVGELLVWAVLGAVVGTALLITTVRARGADRRNSFVLAAWVGVLAVFAVGVDQLHSMVAAEAGPTIATGLAFVETTGELLAMTGIVLAIHRMTLYQRAPSVTGAT